MIRQKHISTSTGTGSTITVSTPSGYSNDISTVRPATGWYYLYVLIDGNGIDWEHGFGRVVSTTFYRDHVVESTNSGSRINLSANTHTILVEESNLTGVRQTIKYNHYKANITAGTTSTLQWDNLSANPDGVTEWPSYSSLSLPSTTLDLGSVLPYSRSYRLTLVLWSEGGSDGTGRIQIAGNGNYYDTFAYHTMPLEASRWTFATVTTMEIENRCPFGTSSTNHCITPETIQVKFTNNATGTHGITAELYVDYLI